MITTSCVDISAFVSAIRGFLPRPDLAPPCLSQEYSKNVESILETLSKAVYTRPNVPRAATNMSDEGYLKLLLTTAGHSEEWTSKNLESVVWLLKCAFKPEGVDPTPGQEARGFSLAQVDEVTLKEAIEQHREVHEYGQYLREAMRIGKGATLKYPCQAAAELLLCFLVRERFQRTDKKETKAADEVHELMNEGARGVEDSEEEMEYVREEFERLRKASRGGKVGGPDHDALLKEAARASWLHIQETPWKSVEGSEDEEEKAIRNFGFIFTAYRPSCWWFELFEMLRKFMMVSARPG
jgi:hypothetical protein